MVRLQALTPLSEGELILGKTNQITVPPLLLPLTPPPPRPSPSRLVVISLIDCGGIRAENAIFPSVRYTRQETNEENDIRHPFRIMFRQRGNVEKEMLCVDIALVGGLFTLKGR